MYVSANFVAGYMYFGNINYILINEYSFNYLKEEKKIGVLMHEYMHLCSNKVMQNKEDVGFVFNKLHFINLNEGLNEIATGYIYNKIYNKEYRFRYNKV